MTCIAVAALHRPPAPHRAAHGNYLAVALRPRPTTPSGRSPARAGGRPCHEGEYKDVRKDLRIAFVRPVCLMWHLPLPTGNASASTL